MHTTRQTRNGKSFETHFMCTLNSDRFFWVLFMCRDLHNVRSADRRRQRRRSFFLKAFRSSRYFFLFLVCYFRGWLAHTCTGGYTLSPTSPKRHKKRLSKPDGRRCGRLLARCETTITCCVSINFFGANLSGVVGVCAFNGARKTLLSPRVGVRSERTEKGSESGGGK